MNNPIARYLLSLFCPPLIGSVLLLIFTAITESSWADLLFYAIAFPFFGFFFCFIPGNAYFALQERVLKHLHFGARNKTFYQGSGTLWGLLSGLAISFNGNMQFGLIFIPIGAIAGLVTASLSFPQNTPKFQCSSKPS